MTIRNPQGLHIRPAAAFAELAGRFESRVSVSRQGQTVDGKLWPDLLLLQAENGADLVLEVDGRDARTAIEALAKQLCSIFEESEPIPEKNPAGHGDGPSQPPAVTGPENETI